MGRTKGKVLAPWPAQQLSSAGDEGQAAALSPQCCSLCRRHVDTEEEDHIAGSCSAGCSDLVLHTDCVVSHLERSLKTSKGINTSQRSLDAILIKIRQRPHQMLAHNGRALRVAQRCPACQEGFMEEAEAVKPVRKLAAAPPPPQPARGPRPLRGVSEQEQREPSAAATPRAAAGGAAAKLASNRFAEAVARQQAAYAAVRQQGSWGEVRPRADDDRADDGWRRDRDNGRSPRGGHGGPLRSQQAQAPHQQRAPAGAWPLPGQEPGWQEPGGADEAAAASELAAAEQRAAERAARLQAEAVARREAALQLSGDALDLMREHRRRACAEALADMGFDADAAAAAAAAAGGSAELAAELLMGGTLAVHDSGPVDVTRRASRLQEARELLEEGAAQGLNPMQVEAALMEADGDWELARRSLPARAVAPEPACTADGGGVDYWQDQPATPWGNEEEEEGEDEEDAGSAVPSNGEAGWQAAGRGGGGVSAPPRQARRGGLRRQQQQPRAPVSQEEDKYGWGPGPEDAQQNFCEDGWEQDGTEQGSTEGESQSTEGSEGSDSEGSDSGGSDSGWAGQDSGDSATTTAATASTPPHHGAGPVPSHGGQPGNPQVGGWAPPGQYGGRPEQPQKGAWAQQAEQQPQHVYHQPVYSQQPLYRQPVYSQQPLYSQPMHHQPVYRQPVYSQPGGGWPQQPAAQAGGRVVQPPELQLQASAEEEVGYLMDVLGIA